jgi:GTPase SAR1 family protein
LTKSIIAVIGNKSDLDHKVKQEQVLEKMEQYKLKHYIETSAKKDDNISQLFGLIIKEILHKIKEDPDLVTSMNEKKVPELKKQAPEAGCKC